MSAFLFDSKFQYIGPDEGRYDFILPLDNEEALLERLATYGLHGTKTLLTVEAVELR